MAKNHFAIKSQSLSTKVSITELLTNNTLFTPSLKNKKGLLFSVSVLENFIEKEARYNSQTLTLKDNRSIRTFSSGEQKKRLLNYLIDEKPDFLILDSPFESLDIHAISNLKQELLKLSSAIILIQIFNRKEEILPLVTHILEIKDDKIIASIPIKEYKFNESIFVFKNTIPKPISHYKDIPNQLISIHNLTINYDDHCILNNINWTINKNEFWQLIGPNGSGKTTILSMIYGNNVKAYGKEVYLFGKKKGSGESVWDIKEKIGYFSPSMLELFQRKTTVKEMILSGFFDSIGLYKTPTTMQKQLADEWIKLLELESKKETPFNNLTTITQRLVLIVRAMIKHPPILILDEPLINLDNQATNIIVALIHKIAQESDTTILFVSHRNVAHLKPDFIYELTPTKNGSLGKIKNLNSFPLT